MISQKQQAENAKARLAAFIAELARYRAQWALPPDKETFINAWRTARAQTPERKG